MAPVLAFFSHVDDLSALFGKGKVGGGRQVVVDQYVGFFDALPSLDGDKAGIAGTRAYQIDFSVCVAHA